MVQVNALNISGAQKPRAYRQEQNQANSAIASDFAGPNEPANPEPYMQWLQQLPGGDKLFRRNSSNTEWLEIMPPFFKGGVRQVLHFQNDVEKRFFNAGVFEPTGTEITITPSSLDSKILILVNQSFSFVGHAAPGANSVDQSFGARIVKVVEGQAAENITTHSLLSNRSFFAFLGESNYIFGRSGHQSLQALDSVNSLGSIKYEILGGFQQPLENQDVNANVFAQRGGAESPSTITAIEVLT